MNREQIKKQLEEILVYLILELEKKSKESTEDIKKLVTGEGDKKYSEIKDKLEKDLNSFISKVRMPEDGQKGDQGERGEKGDKGDKGDDGKDAVIDYDKIIKLVLSQIPKPKDGKDFELTEGMKLDILAQLVDAISLPDEYVLKAEEVINVLEKEEGDKRLSVTAIKGLEDYETVKKQVSELARNPNGYPSGTRSNDEINRLIDAKLAGLSSGSGDVTGGSSSTDNAIARYDGTTGKVIQNSNATIADDGTITAASVSAGASTFTGIDINGTGGNGRIHLKHQSSDPSTQADSTTIFSDSNGDPAYIKHGSTKVNFGEEIYLRVYATENILKGQAVGIGSIISGTKHSAFLVDATTRAGGIAAEDIAINTEGKIIIRGLLKGIDTSAFTGSAWVSETTLGALQNSAPVILGVRSQPVGEYIVSDATDGVMYVNIQAPERLASEIYAQTTTGDTTVQGAISELETSIQNNLLDIFKPSDIAAYNPNNFDDINPNTSSNDFYGMLLGIDNAFGKTRGKMRVPVGAHVSAGQNGTATTTLAPGANNFKLMPFIPYFDFECDQLVANVSTLFAGSNFKFVIYEMVNFRNGSQETGDITDATLIYESGNISGATTGLKTQAVSIQFYAGVTYLIGIRTSAGTLAFTSIAVGALANMQGHGATPATNMFTNHQKTLAFATAADTNPTSFVGINSAFPLIMMRVGSHL